MSRDDRSPSTPRRRGPGREESKRRTRALLLDAALTVFAREGFHAARLDDVAREAGLTKGAVYSNFESKEDLFLALYDHRLDQLAPRMVEAFGRPPQERYAAIGTVLDDASAPDQTWVRLELEFFLFALRDEAARSRLAERQRRVRSALRGTLAQHELPAGSAPGVSLDVLAWTLPALTLALDMQASVTPDDRPGQVWTTLLRALVGEVP